MNPTPEQQDAVEQAQVAQAAETCEECGVVLNSDDLENLVDQQEDWDDDDPMPRMCESCWFGDEQQDAEAEEEEEDDD